MKKSKKILAAILAIVLLIGVLPMGTFTLTASAETSGYYTYTVSNGKATITDCDESISGDLTIPSIIDGYPVTTIGGLAFDNCASLTSVTIPDSVIIIGSYAFFRCKSITSVTIPDSVTSIGDCAFAMCDNLTNVIIPDSVTSIGDAAFSMCFSLTSITIPDSVTRIGFETFYWCSSLTSVTIGDSITSIGDYAFEGCVSLACITIPHSVTSIGYAAFYYCLSLTSVTIGDSITSIGDYAFADCDNLTVYCNVGKVSELLSNVDCKYRCFGDADNDKNIDSDDIVVMRKFLLGLFNENYDVMAADINHDGGFDIRDLVYFKKTISGTFEAKQFSSIKITKQPDRVYYNYYAPDFIGMEFTVSYTDGTEKVVTVTNDNLVIKHQMDTVGYFIDIDGYDLEIMTYYGYDYDYAAHYRGAQCVIDDITFIENPQIDLIELDNVSFNGKDMTVKINYTNGKTETFTLDAADYFELEDYYVGGVAKTPNGILHYAIETIKDDNGKPIEYIVYILDKEISVKA